MIKTSSDLRALMKGLNTLQASIKPSVERAAEDGAKAAESFFDSVKRGAAGIAPNESKYKARKAREGRSVFPLSATGLYLAAIRRSGSKITLRNRGRGDGPSLRDLARMLERDRPHWAIARRLAATVAMKSLRMRMRRVRL